MEINAVFTSNNIEITTDLEFKPLDICVEMNFNGDVYPIYGGEYTAIPKVYKQSLQTRNKSLKDNVIIDKIPTHIVDNESGKTLIIGGIM